MKKCLAIVALLICTRAFAVGGACPTGADYLNSATNSLTTLSALGVTNCYYIALTGSDSNNGTSKATPWLHARGMPNCSGVCLSTLPTAGTGFIFRGGDTWHFGNSGLSPYTGGTWSWSWNGSAGSPIYLGIDMTWFAAGAWARPKLSGDNPTSTSAVASCSFQSGGGNNILSTPVVKYVIWDNFEFTGKCEDHNIGFGSSLYIYDQSAQNTEFQHLYMHGWTHTPFHCSGGSPFCYASTNFTGGVGSGPQTGTKYLYLVEDGSDSDPGGTAQFYDGGNIIAYSVLNLGSQVVLSAMHLFHDNLITNWVDPGDGVAHGNVYEDVGEVAGTNAVYNNVWQHLYKTGIVGVCFWPHPPPGGNIFVFNNVWSDVNCNGNYINIGQNSVAQGTFYLFNNTLESAVNGPIVDSNPAASFSKTSFTTNNHYITDAASPYQGLTQNTAQTEAPMSHATAASQGYSSGGFAWHPTLGTGGTVNTGTNVQSSYCASLTSIAVGDPTLSDAAAACGKDTGYGVSYNATNHTAVYPNRTRNNQPSSGPQNIGAYFFNSAPAVAIPIINPGSSVQPNPTGVSISDATSGATICYTTDGSTPTANGAGTCTHGSTYSVPFSIAVPGTVNAIGSKSGSTDSGIATANYVSLAAPSNLSIFITGP